MEGSNIWILCTNPGNEFHIFSIENENKFTIICCSSWPNFFIVVKKRNSEWERLLHVDQEHIFLCEKRSWKKGLIILIQLFCCRSYVAVGRLIRLKDTISILYPNVLHHLDLRCQNVRQNWLDIWWIYISPDLGNVEWYCDQLSFSLFFLHIYWRLQQFKLVQRSKSTPRKQNFHSVQEDTTNMFYLILHC